MLSGEIGIAIDGPAGAGKSTIAKIIAKQLGIIYLDTGAMYRAVAFEAISKGIDTKNSSELAELIRNIDIKISFINNVQHIFAGSEDITDKIRTTEISMGASNVAAIPEVKLKMIELQRQIASENSVVMDGRDIGTHVMPNARLKIFLTASIEERAKRRYEEQILKGIKGFSLDEVKKEIMIRDENDSNRAFAPLVKADDAFELDTTNMSVEQVVVKIISLIKD